MKYFSLSLFALALILVGIFLPLLCPRSDRINEVACDRIAEGMSLAEVEAIIGLPPGDYTTRWVIHATVFQCGYVDPSPKYELNWKGDQGAIWVEFSCSTKLVYSKVFLPVECRVKQSTLANLAWRFKRFRNRVFSSAGHSSGI
jgi:hypothetical protein